MPRPTKRTRFLAEALAADAAVDAGAPVYRARDVHAWLERVARGAKVPRPAPARRSPRRSAP